MREQLELVHRMEALEEAWIRQRGGHMALRTWLRRLEKSAQSEVT